MLEGSFWTPERVASPGAFKRATNELLAECTDAFRANDRRAMWRILDVLDEALPFAAEEPWVSSHEYAYCLVGLLIGITLANAGEFEYAFLIAHYVNARLICGDARRKALGIAGVKNTEIRLNLLNLLGDLKKQCDVANRDTVLTPQLMCEDILVCAANVKLYVDRNMVEAAQMLPESRAKVELRCQDITNALGWAWLMVIETATRYLPKAVVVDQITRFNRALGFKLAASPWHYKKHAPLDEHSPWYWDYEICKLDLLGELSESDIDYLWARRSAAVRKFAMAEDYDLTNFEVSERREEARLRRRAFEVMADAS